ncbi:hypothetical protein RCL1_004713 [Eukaryota sp. TZLM3-RCL]
MTLSIVSELHNALRWIESGVEHDLSNRSDRALTCYNSGLSHISSAVIEERNDCHKQVYNLILSMFQNRINVISKADTIPKISAEPSSTSRHNESDAAKEEREMSEFLFQTVIQERPQLRFDDVKGLDLPKQALHESVILPKQFPEVFCGLRERWKTILLFGPPGTGKTQLAKACAGETGCRFFEVPPSSIMSKWTGESERFIRTLFRLAEKHAPTLIFFDEIDSIGGSRNQSETGGNSRRLLTELLIQLSNLPANVTVIAATNCEDVIDDALRRRFERRIFIPLPDLEARIELLQFYCKDTKIEEINWSEIGQKTRGYSGADLQLLCREAAMIGMRELYRTNLKNLELRGITMQDFLKALDHIQPAINDESSKEQDI